MSLWILLTKDWSLALVILDDSRLLSVNLWQLKTTLIYINFQELIDHQIWRSFWRSLEHQLARRIREHFHRVFFCYNKIGSHFLAFTTVSVCVAQQSLMWSFRGLRLGEPPVTSDLYTAFICWTDPKVTMVNGFSAHRASSDLWLCWIISPRCPLWSMSVLHTVTGKTSFYPAVKSLRVECLL